MSLFADIPTPSSEVKTPTESLVGPSTGSLFSDLPDAHIVPNAEAQFGFANTFENFLKTTAYEAGPGIIGIAPEAFEQFVGLEPGRIRDFQTEHPVASIGAALLGGALPYGAGLKLGLRAARVIPGLASLLTYGEEATKAQQFVRGAAARGIAQIAPFEAARVAGAGIAEASGQEGALSQTVHRAGLDLALTPLLAGAGAGIKQTFSGAGPRPDLGRQTLISEKIGKLYGDGGELISQFDLNSSIQEKLSHIRLALDHASNMGLEQNTRSLLEIEQNALRRNLRLNTPGKAFEGQLRYVRGVEGDTGNNKATWINGLFEKGAKTLGPKPGKGLTENESQSIFMRARSFVPQFDEHMQFPRVAQATTDGLASNMTRVARSGYIAKEPESGLFVVAKRVADVSKKKVEAGAKESWLVFKTNSPGLFFPENTAFGKIWTEDALHQANRDIRLPDSIQGSAIRNASNLRSAMGVDAPIPPFIEPTNLGQKLKAVLPAPIESARQELVQAGRGIAQKLRGALAPGIVEFSQSPRALRLQQIAQTLFAQKEAQADIGYFGSIIRRAPAGPGQVFSLKAPIREGGIDPLIKTLTLEDVDAVVHAFEYGIAPEKASASPAAKALLNKWAELHRGNSKETAELAKLTGYPHLQDGGQQGPYGVGIIWKGSWRAPILTTDGTQVGMGSGRSRASALKEAQDFIAQAKVGGHEGLHLDPANPVEALGRDTDLELSSKIDYNRPEAIAIEQAKMAQQAGKITKQELGEALYSRLLSHGRQQVDAAFRWTYEDQLSQLNLENKPLHDQFKSRFLAMQGKKPPGLAKNIDNSLNKYMSPVLGNNSASDIVRGLNRTIFDWTFVGDLGFAALNALTPIMTTLPEIAFQLHTPIERLQQYTGLAMSMPEGGPIRAIHFWEPLKILRASFRELFNPDAELGAALERANLEKVTDKKFIEAVSGGMSQEIKESLKGKGPGIVQLIRDFVEFPAAKSEIISRQHAFTMGWITGRDAFGLKGEQLFQYARGITDRSMYLYSTADRSRLITGALGSFFGQFKNWNAHYLANMLTYSKEGLHGNWAPLMWSFAGLGAIGGAASLPLYGLADQFSKFMSDKSLQRFAYDSMGYSEAPGFAQRTMDAMFYGLPAFAGVTLSSRTAAPGAGPRSTSDLLRDIGGLWNTVALDRAKYLGQALGSSLENAISRGSHPIDSPRTQELYTRALAPRSLYKLMSVVDGEFKSLSSGNKLQGDIGFAEQAAMALGATPVEMQKFYDASSELWRDQNTLRTRISYWGEQLAEARLKQDHLEQRQILKSVTLERIPIDSVWKSADRRVYQGSKDLIERQFDYSKARAIERSFDIK